MSESQWLEVVERYLNGEMSGDELARFELLRAENAEVNNRVLEHRHFTGLIKQYGERLDLEKRLDDLHKEIDIHALKEELTIHPIWIVKLWRNHHSKISVAASIAIFAVLFTLFVTGYLTNRESKYEFLGLKIKQLESKVNRLNPHPVNTSNPGNYQGTGFAISSNGYIVTGYHVIRNADSVYVQNAEGKSFRAKIIYTEPQTDIAILEITDTSFVNLSPLPYDIKKTDGDIGENLFTLGYPRDVMVLGAGYLTASTGINSDNTSDSTTYQVSIPVNHGNSGGPLFDNKGNLIGIINARETHVEGAHFAVKSSFLLKAIQDIPSDSLKKTLNINSKNVLAGLNRVDQIKKLQNYVFMVKVYNQ